MNKTFKVLIIVLVILVLAVGGYFSYQKYLKISPEKLDTKQSVVTLSTKLIDNKFGFLSGGEGDVKFIVASGAAWVRPHPGQFLWDAVQKNATADFDFSKTDKEVTQYQNDLAILATIWPFAEWDQEKHPSSDKCKVSENDEFLAKNDKKGRKDYLPLHRCNPTDWVAYGKFIEAIVERYDGDGQNDMPNLKTPIKYWEVMNEPDLGTGVPDDRLKFYNEDATAYAKLLIETAKEVKKTDPEANILIAGAAGGDEKNIIFYKDVLKVEGAKTAFDIANIHCISNGDIASFNVTPYKKMLTDLGLDKPIWVTEAEAIISDNTNINASQTYDSTKNALEAGAQKIFYTRYSFNANEGPGQNAPPKNPNLDPPKSNISGDNPEEAYKEITSL